MCYTVNMEIRAVAHIHNDLCDKFAIPRQPGLVPELLSEIIFEDEFRNPDAIKELSLFSHIWLIWGFSENRRSGESWSPTVRPPRLGGNKRIGVFATRSPYRPNPIGLSCVKIEAVDLKRCTIKVSGADLMNGTPIYDIKPYLPYSDSIAGASAGYAPQPVPRLEVIIAEDAGKELSEEKLSVLKKLLALDPRPAYQHEQKRSYSFYFSDLEISFIVDDNVLTVNNIKKLRK